MLAIAMPPTKAGKTGMLGIGVVAGKVADNTVNSRTKDVCKSKDARKDTPPAAAIDTETSDSPLHKQASTAGTPAKAKKKGR
jgi:hypothetical protein